MVAGLRAKGWIDPSTLGVFFLIRVRRYCARLWLGGCKKNKRLSLAVKRKRRHGTVGIGSVISVAVASDIDGGTLLACLAKNI